MVQYVCVTSILKLHLATNTKHHLSNDAYISAFCRNLCEIITPLWNVKLSIRQQDQLMRMNVQMPDDDNDT